MYNACFRPLCMCEEKLFIHCSFLPPEQDYNTLDSRAVVLSPLGYTET